VSPLPEDLLYAGVVALGERLRARTLSPVELAEACLARLQSLGPRLGAVATLTVERGLAEARAAEAELKAGRWRGPLHGIPYGLKDLVDTGGIPTTWGTRPLAGRVPGRDASVVSRLAEAGAVLVAKLSMIELAGGLGYHTGAASATGPCRTPWDLSRWSGGSSSGSGAAVAAGLVPFALGSETWGSITCPAAFCGVTGLRPTYGVVSRAGVMALGYTLDKVGPLARSAQDCALVLAAIAGEDPADPSTIPPPPALARVRPELPPGLRVALLEDVAGPLGPAAAAALQQAARLLQEAGALVEPARLPDLPYEPLAELLIEAEAVAALEPIIRSGRTRQLADASHRDRGPGDYLPKASAADYVRAMRVRGELQRALAGFFERWDLVLAPNLPVAPPRAEENFDALFQAPDPLGAAGAVAGLPALALPAGFDGGLPLSIQLVAPPLGEARLLCAGAHFQARTDFHMFRPPM
jgi:aspartyl-tRNA(Asn)/glutamyl-tRNA(Gln) amidotransferase subunit A